MLKFSLCRRIFAHNVNITLQNTFCLKFKFSKFLHCKRIIQSQLLCRTDVTSRQQKRPQQWLTSSLPVFLSTEHYLAKKTQMMKITYSKVSPISGTTCCSQMKPQIVLSHPKMGHKQDLGQTLCLWTQNLQSALSELYHLFIFLLFCYKFTLRSV